MTSGRPGEGSPRFVFALLAAGICVLDCGLGLAADQFPFDRDLLLDAAPMRPAKRVPILMVAPDGNATIDLWCKTIPAHIDLSDNAIKIEPGPLPEGLPEMMSKDQCTTQRIQADEEFLAVVSQVTAWRKEGGAVVLIGPKKLKFWPAMN